MKDNAITSKILQIKLSASQSPSLSVDQVKGIVNWGKGNNYPANKLLYWFENNALHGAICKGKSRYLTGTKIECDQEGQQFEEFLKANPFEDWHSLRSKQTLDEVICGGYFEKRVSNMYGVPIQFYHLDFAKCRISECGKFVKYSDDWFSSQCRSVDIPVWREGLVGTSVYIHKRYSPSATKMGGVYPKPEYESCLQDIDTSTRISVFFNSIVRNNFSVGTIVTIKNGQKDPKAQKDLVDRLKGEHAGEENAGKPVIIFTDKDGNPTEVVSLNANDLDKQYQEITKSSHQNILFGHGVNGVLFKQKDDGSKLGRSEIVQEHELFINEYAKPNQVPYNKKLEKLYKLRYNVDAKFDVEQVKPIGLELPLDNQAVIDALNKKNPEIFINYILDHFGIEIPETVDAAGNVVQQTTPVINDNLKGLSAAENADVLRIARDFQKGRSGMTEAMAISRISSYGVSEQEAKKWLGIQFMQLQLSDNKNQRFLELFEKYSHEINLEDDLLEDVPVKFAEVKDPLSATATQLRNSILEELKGNPGVNTKTLAKKYNTSEEVIRKEIDWLLDKELVTTGENGLIPTEKALKRNGEPIETEIYTEYVYGLREDQKGTPIVLSTTRDFCRSMVELTRKKAISYEAIQLLDNEFGDNVWDFRGGYYNGGTETTPFCRHVWKAVTKIRRKK